MLRTLLLVVLATAWPSPGRGAPTAPDSVRVVVEGVRGEVAQNVRARLSIANQSAEVDDRQVVRLHARAEEEVRGALEPFGFYGAQVSSELTTVAGGWVATYRIDPGEPVRIARVDVRLLGPGAQEPALERAVSTVRLRAGIPLRHAEYERTKNSLLRAAVAQGFLDASYETSRVEVDLQRNAADVVLHLETGERLSYGEVRFSQSELNPWVLRRFVTFREGGPLLLDELLLLQSSLSASDYFETASVEPLRREATGRSVPIDVTLRHRPRLGYGIGLGYGTDTGLRATLRGRVRWLNADGHRLVGESRASAIKRTVSTRYLIPLAGGPQDELALAAGFTEDDFEEDRSRSFQLAGSYAHGRGGWREALGITLTTESFDVGEVAQSSTLLVPSIAWSRARGDDAGDPTVGSRVQVSVQGASGSVVSDVSFLQVSARLKAIRRLRASGRIIGRVDLGVTAVEDFHRLPLSFRFFAGGDQSIRGFKHRSVGPEGPSGDVVGGRHLLTATLEYERRILESFGVAVFADAGNAFARWATPLDLESGLGVGARWHSPVGPVSVDLAWAVSRAGAPFRLHFVVGGGL